MKTLMKLKGDKRLFINKKLSTFSSSSSTSLNVSKVSIILLMVSYMTIPNVLALGLWAKFMSMSQKGGDSGQEQQQRQMYQPPRICIQRVPVPFPFPVEKIVEKPVHVQVPVQVPFPVKVRVPVKVPVKVQVPYPVRVNVPQPFPIPYPVYQQQREHPTTERPAQTTERPWTPPPPPPPPPINVFVTPPRVIMQRPPPPPPPPKGEQLQEPDIDDMRQVLDHQDEDEQRYEEEKKEDDCKDEQGFDDDDDRGSDYMDMKSKFSFGMKSKFNNFLGVGGQKWIPTTPIIMQQPQMPIYGQQQQFGQQQFVPQQQLMPMNFGQQQIFGQQQQQLCPSPQQPCVQQRPVSPFKAPFQAIHGYDLRGPKTNFGWPNFLNKNKVDC